MLERKVPVTSLMIFFPDKFQHTKSRVRALHFEKVHIIYTVMEKQQVPNVLVTSTINQ
jgi:hypothetical protein